MRICPNIYFWNIPSFIDFKIVCEKSWRNSLEKKVANVDLLQWEEKTHIFIINNQMGLLWRRRPSIDTDVYGDFFLPYEKKNWKKKKINSKTNIQQCWCWLTWMFFTNRKNKQKLKEKKNHSIKCILDACNFARFPEPPTEEVTIKHEKQTQTRWNYWKCTLYQHTYWKKAKKQQNHTSKHTFFRFLFLLKLFLP